MNYPLRLIEWHDAYNGDHVWFDAADLPPEDKTFTVLTMGFEVKRTERHVTLAMSVTSGGKLCDLFTIPLGMIVKEHSFRRRG